MLLDGLHAPFSFLSARLRKKKSQQTKHTRFKEKKWQRSHATTSAEEAAPLLLASSSFANARAFRRDESGLETSSSSASSSCKRYGIFSRGWIGGSFRVVFVQDEQRRNVDDDEEEVDQNTSHRLNWVPSKPATTWTRTRSMATFGTSRLSFTETPSGRRRSFGDRVFEAADLDGDVTMLSEEKCTQTRRNTCQCLNRKAWIPLRW